VSFIFKKTGTFFIRRGRATELKSLSQYIKTFLNKGENLMFFPEGKTGNGANIQALYSGLFQIAIDTDVKVQPVFLSYEDISYPAKIVPYVAGQNIFVNLWHITNIENIKINIVVMGDAINPQNMSRKEVVKEVEIQLNNLLRQELQG